MLTTLSYQKKCLALLLLFLAFLLLGYRLSFKHTFELKGEIRDKEKKLAWLSEKEKEIPFLRSKLKLVEKAYNTGDSTSLRDQLTAFISDQAVQTRCTVTEIPYSKLFTTENLWVETNVFTVRGSFKELLGLEYAIENKFRILARIMSARFFSIRDLQTKHKGLYLTLTIQSFNQINHSKL